jgi:hypothetical protein
MQGPQYVVRGQRIMVGLLFQKYVCACQPLGAPKIVVQGMVKVCEQSDSRPHAALHTMIDTKCSRAVAGISDPQRHLDSIFHHAVDLPRRASPLNR